MSASGIVITDLLPNGVCPVWSTQAPAVTGVLPADCGTGGSPAGSDPTGAALSTVTRNSDGTFTLVFAPLAAAANGTITVTYQGRMRTEYTGGSLAGLPTSSGDTYTNTVSLVGTTDTRRRRRRAIADRAADGQRQLLGHPVLDAAVHRQADQAQRVRSAGVPVRAGNWELHPRGTGECGRCR